MAVALGKSEQLTVIRVTPKKPGWQARNKSAESPFHHFHPTRLNASRPIICRLRAGRIEDLLTS